VLLAEFVADIVSDARSARDELLGTACRVAQQAETSAPAVLHALGDVFKVIQSVNDLRSRFAREGQKAVEMFEARPKAVKP
jgi:hypothetical protein